MDKRTEMTLPVGSVIEVKGLRMVTVGVQFEEEDNRLVKMYICVPYPTGFTGAEHVRAVPAREAETVWEGYCSPLAEPFLALMDGIDMASQQADAETVLGYLEQARIKVSGGEG